MNQPTNHVEKWIEDNNRLRAVLIREFEILKAIPPHLTNQIERSYFLKLADKIASIDLENIELSARQAE
jgi:hypothetical protein